MTEGAEIPVATSATEPADVPPVSSGTTQSVEEIMADVPANVHEQTLSRLSSAGASAHEHFVQFGKVLDYAYEADRKQVSLVQALGVREVTSRAGQEGIPIAATAKAS